MTTILHILQHSLGLDEYGRGKPYRNHYCIGERCDGFDLCRDAVAQGFMQEHAPREISGGDYIFTVTDAGRAYVREHSPAPPKLTRSKQRYLAFVDADCGLTFGEWLKAGRDRGEQR